MIEGGVDHPCKINSINFVQNIHSIPIHRVSFERYEARDNSASFCPTPPGIVSPRDFSASCTQLSAHTYQAVLRCCSNTLLFTSSGCMSRRISCLRGSSAVSERWLCD